MKKSKACFFLIAAAQSTPPEALRDSTGAEVQAARETPASHSPGLAKNEVAGGTLRTSPETLPIWSRDFCEAVRGNVSRFLIIAGKANCFQAAVVGGASFGAMQKVFWLLLIIATLSIQRTYALSDLIVYGGNNGGGDLTVTPSSAVVGNNVTIGINIENIGSTVAAASTTHLQIKDSATRTVIIVDTYEPTPSVASGVTINQNYTVQIPPGTIPGSYAAYVVLDAYNVAGQGGNTANDYGSSSAFNICPSDQIVRLI